MYLNPLKSLRNVIKTRCEEMKIFSVFREDIGRDDSVGAFQLEFYPSFCATRTIIKEL